MKHNQPAIILVRPQLPENIGMVARVMENYNLNELIIVSPREKWPNKKSLESSKKAKTNSLLILDLHLISQSFLDQIK